MSNIPPAPAELRYLADLIGDAATLALIEWRGGTCIHVPAEPKETHELSLAIGWDAAKNLAREWRNNRLKIPTAKRWRAVVYRAQGKSYTQIALAIGVTETAVWRWVGPGAPGMPASAQSSLLF